MANGLMAPASLAAVHSAPGQRLRIDAAASWDRLAAAVEARSGHVLVLTDSYRPIEVQKRIFLERYVQHNTGTGDLRYWYGVAYWRLRGVYAAAVPGTSNHGSGLAVDASGLGGFAGALFMVLAALALEHGWTNTEGRSVDEPWHWVYDPAHDTHRNASVPEDDMALTPDDLEKLATAVWGKILTGHGRRASAQAFAVDTRELAGRLDGVTAGITTLLAQRTESSGGKVDYALLAKAVVDEEHRRLEK